MAIRSADQISIVDVTDAYSVMLTSDSHTFPGSVSAAIASSVTTQVVAMQGASKVPAKVTLSEITKPSGVTVTSDNNSMSPTLTITVSTAVVHGGSVVIPVHVGDVTINKEFTFAIAFTGATGETGATGNGIQSTVITYQKHTNGTTAPTGTWLEAVPSASAGEYIWTRTVITYTNNTDATFYSVSMIGETGPQGEDAITLIITSSNGTIFKNSAIATVLTAHVYKAGTELSATEIAKLGTIKWYKDGGASAVATGNTMTIDSGDVTNKATYVAQLEG